MVYILYNPESHCACDTDSFLEKAKEIFKNKDVSVKSLMEIDNMKVFFDTLKSDDEVVLIGGDGTLNVFCNNLRGYEIKNNIYLYKGGTGNDFLRDVCKDEFDTLEIKQINEYIENLPVVTINGKEYLFINNVGFGIDGRVCTKAEELRENGKQSINYTTVAIKLLLTEYKPCGATVTVDGNMRRFRRVWMAPVMNGLFYGGGMMPAPQQDRNSDDISCCVVHSTNALQTLMIFPSIFKGEHIKYKKKVVTLSGKEIRVEFDSPKDVQIDGETIKDVSVITAEKYGTLAKRDKNLLAQAK
ncbi:MAG: diacylglycerol kinase family protein [Ruminococcus sp.]|nr:diacylglycerol kinase family protein [Ruminococcus sp.]